MRCNAQTVESSSSSSVELNLSLNFIHDNTQHKAQSRAITIHLHNLFISCAANTRNIASKVSSIHEVGADFVVATNVHNDNVSFQMFFFKFNHSVRPTHMHTVLSISSALLDSFFLSFSWNERNLKLKHIRFVRNFMSNMNVFISFSLLLS